MTEMQRDDDPETVETLADDTPPDDTSGGPLSSGAGEGAASHPDAPDLDVPGGADEGV